MLDGFRTPYSFQNARFLRAIPGESEKLGRQEFPKDFEGGRDERRARSIAACAKAALLRVVRIELDSVFGRYRRLYRNAAARQQHTRSIILDFIHVRRHNRRYR